MTKRRQQGKTKVTRPEWEPSFLREWREAKDMTLDEVAQKMGITHGQLSKIERGLSPYSQNILEVAAEEYGCTVQDLLTRTPEDGETVFSIWGELDDVQKQQAIGLLRVLKTRPN